MTPTSFHLMMVEAFVAEVKKRGVRGLARESGMSPTYISRIKGGHIPVPVDGKLAEYLRATLTNTAHPPPPTLSDEVAWLRAEVDVLRKAILTATKPPPKGRRPKKGKPLC